MTVPEILDALDALGLKAIVLVAGFAGGALRALSRRDHKKRELLIWLSQVRALHGSPKTIRNQGIELISCGARLGSRSRCS